MNTNTTGINKINNDVTTVGKSGKVAIWSGASVIILAVLASITNNPQLFSWHQGVLVVAANVLIVFLKNMFDSNTPTV